MINYQEKKLKNGLRIITAPMKETKVVTVLFLINAGSRYETKTNNGIFHFLEHLFFKGTKKRPTSLDISKELDWVGADFNAFTSDEATGFYVSLSANNFSLASDILSDILLHSQFPEAEITKEKAVIFEEINMYRDLPQRYILDLAKEQIFGDTPLGRSTLGTLETLKNITRNDLVKTSKKFYHPENMVVVVAGAENKIDWFNNLNEQLGSLEKSEKIVPETNIASQNKPRVHLHSKKTDQAHLILSWRTFSRFDKRRYELKILNNILGETMSSRLFTQIREKRGLAYYIGSDIWEFSDIGAQVSFAGLKINKISEAIKIIKEEYLKICTAKITSEELHRAKENLKGKIYLGLEDSFSIANFLGEQQLLFDKIKQPEQIIKDFAKVSQKDLEKLAQEIFLPQNLNLTVIGPYKDKKFLEKLLCF